MTNPAIVIHYHELWLKGRNRKFYLRKLSTSIRTTLQGIHVLMIEQAGDRMIVWLRAGAPIDDVIVRLKRVPGIAFFAVAHDVDRNLDAISSAAWDEIRPLDFRSFAVRAKRSDKAFPHSSVAIEKHVGAFLQEKLHAAVRSARVRLKDPDVTCFVEITPRPALVYANKIDGVGGLPANTAGRMMCLLSGGFDSAVAAYHMIKRGAHLSFVHFYAAGAKPGESSLHVATELVRQLTPYQIHARLFRVPFDATQREIVRFAPEQFRVLLYRRMMLRIAEACANRDRALALITGDSLSQVASQTLRNLVAVDSASKLSVFRPLIGADKQDILSTARKIGTYEISSEPYHDCCPVFLPRHPALRATAATLDEAESSLNVTDMLRSALAATTSVKLVYKNGAVEVAPPASLVATSEAAVV